MTNGMKIYMKSCSPELNIEIFEVMLHLMKKLFTAYTRVNVRSKVWSLCEILRSFNE